MENSDEDKLIMNGEMFFSIRKYIRLKKPSADIVAKIEDLLKEGADVNFCDSNDKSNTILHIAAQNEEKDVVLYLLQKGALLFTNKDGKTAIDLALQKNTKLGNEIAEALSKHLKPAARITGQNSKKQQIKVKEKDQTQKTTNTVVTYSKRAGTSGVSGQFYETKLLSLVVHRALHDKDIEEFLVAANIKDIGDFDDLCFRNGNIACFMQTKHRENTDKAKLTVASVRSTTGKLGLGIYFDSFLKIRQKFSPYSTDPMFKGRFDDIDSYYILYTPLKESFERKLTGNKKMCSKLHDIIYTGDTEHSKSTDMFQFDYEDRDLIFLCEFIKHEKIKNLGKTFLEFILSNNKIEVMMANELIKIYHPALAQKVISISRIQDLGNTSKNSKCLTQIDSKNSLVANYIHVGKFRQEFFHSNDYNLMILKDTFYKEIVYTHSSKTTLSKEEIKQNVYEILMNPCAETISKLIGSPLKYDDINDKLILDINKLPKNKYKLDEIQQIRYDLQKISVTKTVVKDAIYLAGKFKLESLTFALPLSFGNVDLTTNQKTKEGARGRLNFLAEKIHSLLLNGAENTSDGNKIINISSNVVGPGKIFEISHLNSNGGIGGAVGNLLKFDSQTELFTFNTKQVLEENATYVLEKLKELTNEDLSHYKINIIIDNFPRVSFDTYQYDKNIAAEFMSKLWFYTNQAQEESVEMTIKEEISIFYNADKQKNKFLFHVHSDAIFLRFHDEIQKWWKKQTEAEYLTKNTIIFEKAKKDIVDSPILTVLNVMFLRRITQLNINFNTNALHYLNIEELLAKSNILNIVSDVCILSAVKIMQACKCDNKFTYINLDYVHILPQNDYEIMIDELRMIKNVTPVIISETTLDGELQNTLQRILTTFTNQSELHEQLIIITSEPLAVKQASLFKNHDYFTIKDTHIDFIDLNLPTQTSLLNTCKITYQGENVTLNTILDDTSMGFINSKLLWSLLNKENLEIGFTLNTRAYDEVQNHYISRNLIRKGVQFEISTLNDINDKVVLISSKLCMGKTTLLTHLSLETRKIDPKVWIVPINISTNAKKIARYENNDLNTVLTFLSEMAINKSGELQKIYFTEIDNETVVIKSKESDNIPFELQLFIHFYNSGNVIFLFDGFDMIYPHYTNQGINLFKTLSQAHKRMWITGNSYVMNLLEPQFGASYKLKRLSTTKENNFLQQFWTMNLKLEKLNHEQFNNITLFCNYILRAFNREINICENDSDRSVMPMLSWPIHILYLILIKKYKNETQSISPCYLRDRIRQKFRLDSYTVLDKILGRIGNDQSLDLAKLPIHSYVAKTYFAFQITNKFDLKLDTKLLQKKSSAYINTISLYNQFLKENMKNICLIEDHITNKEDLNKLRDDFFNRHKKLALYAICKESDLSKFLTDSELREIKDTLKIIESGELKTPFIDSIVDGIPRFYHTLFAEYFISEFLLDFLRSLKCKRSPLKFTSLWDSLVNVVLVSASPSLRNAFEYQLKCNPEQINTANDNMSNKIIFKMLLKPNHKREHVSRNDNGDRSTIAVKINEDVTNIANLLHDVRTCIDKGNKHNIITTIKDTAALLEKADTSRKILKESVSKLIEKKDVETVASVVLNSTKIGQDIQNKVNAKIVEPIKNFTEKIVKESDNNENVVRLVEQLPHHVPDLLRSLFRKRKK